MRHAWPFFLCKRLDNKYFRLGGATSFCRNYSTLPLYHESSHRRYASNEYGCVPIALYLQKQTRQIWPLGQSFPTPGVRLRFQVWTNRSQLLLTLLCYFSNLSTSHSTFSFLFIKIVSWPQILILFHYLEEKYHL